MTECERIIDKNILPEDFFREEFQSDFHVTEKRKKIWAIELDLLLEFDRVCKKYDLKYFLFFGTLLGAVRHGGFIPWDDDLDVVMPRKDYEKLLKFDYEFADPYFLQNDKTDVGFFYSFSKLRNSNTTALDKPFMYQGFNSGIFIDILPLDNVRKESYKQVFTFLHKINYDNSTYMRLSNPNLSESDVQRAALYEGKTGEENLELFNSVARQYEDEKTDYVSVFSGSLYGLDRDLFLASDFNKCVNISFENYYYFPIPERYDSILKKIYGNYDNLPPAEERGRWHKNVFFDPDRSYKSFLENKDFAWKMIDENRLLGNGGGAYV